VHGDREVRRRTEELTAWGAVAAPVALLLASLLPARAQESRPSPLPAPGELNPLVVRVFESYPRDGSHGYWWPKGSPWEGTTRDLLYLGRKIATGDPQKRSYCCGFTFEVFFRAWEEWCGEKKVPFRIGDLNAETIGDFRRAWYGSDGDRRTLFHALVDARLGVPVEKWEEARPGDFVQFWRKNGTGHSAILLDWERRGREIVGIRFGSSQGSTKGIGVKSEFLREEAERRAEGEKGIDPAQIHIARAGRAGP
jgi:hypothetical protein